jgi:hypothetical protein
VKQVEYWGHGKGRCFTAADAKDWESLAAVARDWDSLTQLILRPSVITMADNHLFGPDKCRCIEYISPRKLVTRGSGLKERRIDKLPFDAECKTTVSTATNPTDLHFLSCDVLRLCHKEELNVNKSIFIYLDITLTAPAWDLYLARLFGVVKLAICPNDIVLVNLEIPAGRDISLEDRKDMTPVQLATDTKQKAYLAYLARNGTTFPEFKTAEQARQVKFTFVSMPTYLAEYDWEGELTEEEVRPWLEERIQDSGKD